jgi:hypothetical protein
MALFRVGGSFVCAKAIPHVIAVARTRVRRIIIYSLQLPHWLACQDSTIGARAQRKLRAQMRLM